MGQVCWRRHQMLHMHKEVKRFSRVINKRHRIMLSSQSQSYFYQRPSRRLRRMPNMVGGATVPDMIFELINEKYPDLAYDSEIQGLLNNPDVNVNGFINWAIILNQMDLAMELVTNPKYNEQVDWTAPVYEIGEMDQGPLLVLAVKSQSIPLTTIIIDTIKAKHMDRLDPFNLQWRDSNDNGLLMYLDTLADMDPKWKPIHDELKSHDSASPSAESPEDSQVESTPLSTPTPTPTIPTSTSTPSSESLSPSVIPIESSPSLSKSSAPQITESSVTVGGRRLLVRPRSSATKKKSASKKSVYTKRSATKKSASKKSASKKSASKKSATKKHSSKKYSSKKSPSSRKNHYRRK